MATEKLVGEQHLPEHYVARVKSLRPSYSCFLAHIGVRGLETAQLEAAHGYYWSGWDSDRVAHGDFDCKFFVPSLYWT